MQTQRPAADVHQRVFQEPQDQRAKRDESGIQEDLRDDPDLQRDIAEHGLRRGPVRRDVEHVRRHAVLPRPVMAGDVDDLRDGGHVHVQDRRRLERCLRSSGEDDDAGEALLDYQDMIQELYPVLFYSLMKLGI